MPHAIFFCRPAADSILFCFFGLNKFSRPNGRLSPIACHTYLASYDTQLQFGLSGNSASYKASDFCWQTILYFLEHLRPSHMHCNMICRTVKHFRCPIDSILSINNILVKISTNLTKLSIFGQRSMIGNRIVRSSNFHNGELSSRKETKIDIKCTK